MMIRNNAATTTTSSGLPNISVHFPQIAEEGTQSPEIEMGREIPGYVHVSE